LDLRSDRDGIHDQPLNVSVTALQASSGIYYVPKWTEFAATLATITAAVVAFRYAVIYLNILPKNPPEQQRTVVLAAPANA
jgi:hypothetical protein